MVGVGEILGCLIVALLCAWGGDTDADATLCAVWRSWRLETCHDLPELSRAKAHIIVASAQVE